MGDKKKFFFRFQSRRLNFANGDYLRWKKEVRKPFSVLGGAGPTIWRLFLPLYTVVERDPLFGDKLLGNRVVLFLQWLKGYGENTKNTGFFSALFWA